MNYIPDVANCPDGGECDPCTKLLSGCCPLTFIALHVALFQDESYRLLSDSVKQEQRMLAEVKEMQVYNFIISHSIYLVAIITMHCIIMHCHKAIMNNYTNMSLLYNTEIPIYMGFSVENENWPA